MTTAESSSSSAKKQYYDADYFDSDEDNDNTAMTVDNADATGQP
jgi:hypothetical protein